MLITFGVPIVILLAVLIFRAIDEGWFLSWQVRLDRQIEKDRDRRIADWESDKSRKDAEGQAELGRKFQCGICGIPAQEQGWVSGTGTDHFGMGVSSKSWSKPGDMLQCHDCKRWVCMKHWHKSLYLCRDCAKDYVNRTTRS